MQIIEFKNKEYKIRELYLKDFGNISISTSSLNERLVRKSGSYVSEEARYIDEQLFFFVEEDEIDLPEKKLILIIEKQVS